jgi:hypothetical protein
MSDDTCMNTKIENALMDKDISKIMTKATRPFLNQLNSEDVYTCKINALWKSFLNYDPDFGTKFTTYLYTGVFIECLKAAKFLEKSKRFKQLHDGVTVENNDYELFVDILDEAENSQEKNMIIDKMSKMTNKELSAKYGLGKETMRKKMKKITSKFRHKFT